MNTYDLRHRRTIPALEEHWGILKENRTKSHLVIRFLRKVSILFVVIEGHAYGRLTCPSGKSDSLPRVGFLINLMRFRWYTGITYKRILAQPHEVC